MKLLGLDLGTSYHVRTRWGWMAATRRDGRPTKRPSPRTWQSALRGKFGIAVSGLRATTTIVLDVDLGHGVDPRRLPSVVRGIMPAEAYDPDLPDVVERYLEARRRLDRFDSKAARMRQHVALKLLPALRPLQAAGIPHAVESSSRGAHLVFRLPHELELHEAVAVGERLRGMLGPEVRHATEVFPTREGRMCRSPLTGTARLLGADVETPKNRWRLDDVRELLSLAPIDASLFASPPLAKTNEVPRTKSRASKASSPKGDKPKAAGQLRGGSFSDELVRHYELGIPEAGSWSAARRWSFALVVGVGLTLEEAERAFAKLLEVRAHGARHAQTKHGRRELSAKFRSCARRHARAVAAGDLEPGKMSDPRVRRIVRALLGVATLPLPGALPVRTKKAKSRRRKLAVAVPKDAVAEKLAAAREERSRRARGAARSRWSAGGMIWT